jgi:AraC family transcriptional regulator
MAQALNSHQKEQLRKEYIGRINKSIDYIENNISENLNLEEIAEIANFSKFHFHRIFGAMIGETLNAFVKRIRMERSASLLVGTAYSITEIGEQVGFNSQAAFARAFKDYYKISASEFRKIGLKNYSKICKTESNNHQLKLTYENYISNVKNNKKNRLIMKVEIKDLNDIHVAYCRHIGSYSEIGQAFEKLMRWAGPRGLLNSPDVKTIGLYHDDPAVTEQAKLRSSACVTVEADTKVDGEIGKTVIEGGKYAMARFEIDETEFQQAWNQVMGEWLPESGYQCDDKLPFEMYYGDPNQHPEKKFVLDICVPVKPL